MMAYFRDLDPVVGRAASAKRKLKRLEELYENASPRIQFERSVLERETRDESLYMSTDPIDRDFKTIGGFQLKRKFDEPSHDKVIARVQNNDPPPPLPTLSPAMSTRSRTAAANATAKAAEEFAAMQAQLRSQQVFDTMSDTDASSPEEY